MSTRLEQFQKSKEGELCYKGAQNAWLLITGLCCNAGKIVTALVREFLDYFELEYTRSVFDPETNAVSVVSFSHG